MGKQKKEQNTLNNCKAGEPGGKGNNKIHAVSQEYDLGKGQSKRETASKAHENKTGFTGGVGREPQVTQWQEEWNALECYVCSMGRAL